MGPPLMQRSLNSRRQHSKTSIASEQFANYNIAKFELRHYPGRNGFALILIIGIDFALQASQLTVDAPQR
jgi:hypothetical protein